ncbi:hypothetical protein C2E21_8570 [Chlorella sorokiniana]|uniref:Uncharacterized protein n=1 Tax=Chlorella sorokiniana TaxID=3076 RepID=A0A2P6TE35_CHLSO|nr:hypothetical protein C2E21_8570 [Chlorella sorokiniana]|eukprot:PRW20901.1 hypothetical protein C2E21_8570 [Chlorella sorokiniana]
MTVQSAKKDGQLEVTVQLASALPGAGTRLPVAFAGFGLPGWDQRKSKSITKDRCTLTFDGPASQQQQLEALGAELAAGTRKATAAVAGAACSSTAAEGSATRTQALLLELQPQAAELRTEPEQIDSAAATAVKQSLWTWLGSLGRQLVPLLLAANNAPVSLDARLQRLEAKTETVGTQADVLADHVDSQFSGLASALCEQQGSISHLEERVRLLEVSAGRSSQQTAATADAGQPPDVEMAAADSRKRSRLTGASEAEAQALPPLAPAAAQQQQQQQQQQRGGSTPLGSDASVLHTCAMPAEQKSLITRHITTLAYNLSCRPGSWVVRWQQGETAYYSLAHSWATGAAAVAAAAAAPAAAVGQ